MNTIYEVKHNASPLGFSYEWKTSSGGHIPMHWHQEMELMYLLNGEATMNVSGETKQLRKRHLVVVEEKRIHSVHCRDDTTMFLCVHISKEALNRYIPNIEFSTIELNEEFLNDQQYPKYLEICQRLEDLTRSYIVSDEYFTMEADGIILKVMALLLRNFAKDTIPEQAGVDIISADRIRKIIDYVAVNYQDSISLADGAEVLGLGREAFSRFFKRMMGMSFLQYVNEVRLSHSYEDLMRTELPIHEIMEKNGLTNQKLFNRRFKEYYGMTPSEARKHPEKQDQMAKMYGIQTIESQRQDRVLP